MCHSELWVDGEGCVTAITGKGEVRRTQPINTAVIDHYNSIRLPDGTKDPSLERFFANEIEGPVAPVLARVGGQKRRDLALESRFDQTVLARDKRLIERDGFFADRKAYSVAFSAADQRALTRYIASLIVRVPSYKDELKSSQMLENVAAVLGLAPEAARFQTDLVHVDIVHRHLKDYAERLEHCGFVFFDAPEGTEFIIGDTPVIPAALGFGDAEAMCPITPKRALIIVSNYRAPFDDRIGVFRARPPSVRAFNKTMIQNAEREIFCRSPFPIDVVTKHLGSSQIRLAPNIKTAAGEHSAKGPMLDRPVAAPESQNRTNRKHDDNERRTGLGA